LTEILKICLILTVKSIKYHSMVSLSLISQSVL